MTESQKKKISKSNMGRVISQEARDKTSKTLMGNVISPETRKKISIANKGKKKPPRTKQQIEKHLLSMSGKFGKNKGKTFSEDAKLRMKIGSIGQGSKMSKEEKDALKERARIFYRKLGKDV